MNAASFFHMPTRIRVGRGSRSYLVEELRRIEADRVLLISDEGVASAGWVDDVLERAAAAGCTFERRTDVEPNPKSPAVDELAAAARTFNADCVVGIGGGSVLDAGKAVALLLRNSGSCTDFEGLDRFQHAPAPFIALPTTCGTGSEVTRVSVITVPAKGRKISVKGDAMFPTAALVDPDFIDTLPLSLVSTTGMDALTHAIESVIGRPANPVSDALAAEAVRRLFSDLPVAGAGSAADAGVDPSARESIMLASMLAGMAFGNADVGAVHCLSESIGGQTDLPHGLLNAVLLGAVLRYQADAISDRLARLDSETGGSGTAHGFVDRVSRLATDLDIPSISDLSLDPSRFQVFAQLAEQNGSNASNLMPLEARDYLNMLRSASVSE